MSLPINTLSCYLGRIDELDEDFEKNGIMWVDFEDFIGKDNKKKDEDGNTIRKVIASWSLRAAYAAWINPPVLKYKGRLTLNGKMSIDEMEFKCEKVSMSGKGKIALNNAQLSNVTISGGAPMPPCPAVCGPLPGTAGPIPPVISGASGVATIEAKGPMGEIEFNTDDATIKFKSEVTFNVEDNKGHFGLHTANSGLDGFDIELKLDKAQAMPWCTDLKDIYGEDQTPDDGDDMTAEDKQSKAMEREDFIKVGENGDLALCMAFRNSMEQLYCVDIISPTVDVGDEDDSE